MSDFSVEPYALFTFGDALQTSYVNYASAASDHANTYVKLNRPGVLLEEVPSAIQAVHEHITTYLDDLKASFTNGGAEMTYCSQQYRNTESSNAAAAEQTWAESP